MPNSSYPNPWPTLLGELLEKNLLQLMEGEYANGSVRVLVKHPKHISFHEKIE